ncbi:MAG: hypothetical protein HYU84_00025 [Chloroflexi bacterium]|nr:hypothetical protein [Chloroflexota bacterium]
MNFSGKLGLQQRVLPSYRVPFFDLLASHCEGGMSLFAGQARHVEMIASGTTQIAKHVEADNLHLLGGPFYLCYQRGFINWLEDWNPDALIMEANPRYLASPSAVNWMHKRGRNVLGWGLGFPSPSGRGAGVRARFLHQFDGMIAYSQRGAEEYAALGFPREKIFVAHNSVSPAPAEPMPTRPSTYSFIRRTLASKKTHRLITPCLRRNGLQAAPAHRR